MNVRQVVQHIDDIDIPIIEITEGWPAESVQTRKNCDDAFAYLMSACAGIEYQIDMEISKPKTRWDNVWLAKARCALKYKKAALQIVNQRRAVINDAETRIWKDSRDRKLLEYIRAVVPNHQFLEWLRASGVAADADPEAK
jgi:hypothetical protein